MTDPLSGQRIVLGVSGSIAAYKAVALASELTKAGALVDVVLTPAATRFVQPLSFEAIVHRPALADLFDPTARSIAHVALGVDAAALVVAPATADCLAGLALGLAHDALLATALSSRAPLLLAPAMETLMFEHPATQANLATLRSRGAQIVEPTVGPLASGRVGRGRMAEPSEIAQALRQLLAGAAAAPTMGTSAGTAAADLAGRRIVVTAGGTQEPIDPVRFIGNRSSGKMGYAVAAAAQDRGAAVVLISGPSALKPPPGVILRPVVTALELQAAVEAAVADADAIVMAAAVADYRVATVSDHKLKRTGDDLVLRLVPNPDIIAGLKDRPLVKVGFAAETDDLVANAQDKLRRKGLDLIVANDVSAPGSGFGTDTNQVVLLDATGAEVLPLMSKREVADRILDRVVRRLRDRSLTGRMR
jgi:phosphopantothenoylcysteine decarboxylase/phosphopantothenate--cysteine ligase